MSYDNCPSCKRFVRLEAHTCPPKWVVWVASPNLEEAEQIATERTIYADDADEAAERFASVYDEGSVMARDGDELLVAVSPVSDGHGGRVLRVVTCETEPVYQAQEACQHGNKALTCYACYQERQAGREVTP